MSRPCALGGIASIQNKFSAILSLQYLINKKQYKELPIHLNKLLSYIILISYLIKSHPVKTLSNKIFVNKNVTWNYYLYKINNIDNANQINIFFLFLLLSHF